jgi:hypothetical protein
MTSAAESVKVSIAGLIGYGAMMPGYGLDVTLPDLAKDYIVYVLPRFPLRKMVHAWMHKFLYQATIILDYRCSNVV